MSSAPASASAIPDDPAPDLLPECPELQVPSGTVTIAEENLYRMMDLLASSDNLSFDLQLKYIERIAAVQEKLLGIRKAIHQLDCALFERQSAKQQHGHQSAAPSAAAQAANSTAAIDAVDAVDSPNESRSLNHPPISLGQIAPIPEIPPLEPLAPLSSGLTHSKPETASSAMATPAVTATPATRATRACSANQIMNQLSQAIAGIDQLSSELHGKLEKAVPPGAAPASSTSAPAPPSEQTTTFNDDAHSSATNLPPSASAAVPGQPFANPPTSSLISDA